MSLYQNHLRLGAHGRLFSRITPVAPILCAFLLSTACTAGLTGSGLTEGDDPDTIGVPIEAGSSTPAGTQFGDGDSGTKALQRLDSVAFDNTVQDLTGTTLTLAADNFPIDNRYYNFDNVGVSLGLSETLQSVWFDSAMKLGAEVTASAADRNARETIYAKVAPCAVAADVDARGCLRQTVQNFGLRAWRRPLSAAEVNTLVQLATAAGAELPAQVGAAVSAMLSSPYFFFRVELDPTADAPAVHALNAYEVATRLSYFLWRSCPDDELLSAAKNGSLLTDAGLKAQVTRMLGNARAQSLVTEFGGRWVGLDRLEVASPDTSIYPNFNEDVRKSMRLETETYLNDFVLRGAPLGQMLTSNYSYLDARLSSYYGIPTTAGNTPVRTSLPTSSGRRGLLSQGSILVAGSGGNAGSAVKRGRFVLDSLLCRHLDNPPDNVAAGSENTDSSKLTQRQALALHVADPACAGCHVDMDAIGFAFGNFSGSGERRTLDQNQPIDTTGLWNRDKKFASNVDMVDYLAADADFTTCATETLFIYAIGRPSTTEDSATLAGLEATLTSNRQSMPVLIQQVVLSRAFRSRHG